ncbi:hypothetical protein HUJ04_009279 [Dendroctonus ponderosae]|nr:hypothetical protein HUJ04_009279 [Dendroctonus ponderosae]
MVSCDDYVRPNAQSDGSSRSEQMAFSLRFGPRTVSNVFVTVAFIATKSDNCTFKFIALGRYRDSHY